MRCNARGFTLIELMIIFVILAILGLAVFALASGHSRSSTRRWPSNLTAQSNIRRYVHGRQDQIMMITCNDKSPNRHQQVSCLAEVRDALEGNTFEMHLLCDQTRDEDDARHESTGCVLDTSP